MISNQQGYMMVLVMLVVAMVSISTVLTIGGSQLFYQNSSYTYNVHKAQALAEAGIDKAVASLNKTGGSYNGETETVLGDGSYSVSVTDKNATTKLVEATGYYPSKANPKVKRTVSLQISKGVGVAFNYGVQVGEGGLLMSNNAVVNGSVYSNGNITMNNNAVIAGDAYVAGGTQSVADQQADCSSSNCTDFIFGKNISGNNQLDVAQSFRPSITTVLNKVSLKLKKFGSPSNVTVRILADNNGSPNKNQVLASGVLSASTVTSSYSFVDIAFSNSPSLTAGNTYWIMIDTSSNSSNYWAWSLDLAASYNNGNSSWSANWSASNPVWNNINGDLGFNVYMGGVSTYIQGTANSRINNDAHANTLTNLVIGGGAYYQSSSGITAGSLHPGSADPAPASMSISQANIDDWRNQATNFNSNLSSPVCGLVWGPGKYDGDISLPSNCTITVKSPIWVTGNFSMTNNDIVKLDSSAGGSSGVFIVDNFITMANNNKILGSGTTGSYLILLSEFSSKNDPEHRIAINVSNNGNSGVVYADEGEISISNNNTMTEITAWKLTLQNNVIIDYDQGLAGAFFSSGPSGAFSAIKGTYLSL
jgi:hypothetical protein